MSFSLSVVLVDKVYNHFQHGVLFLSTAFRYHQVSATRVLSAMRLVPSSL